MSSRISRKNRTVKLGRNRIISESRSGRGKINKVVLVKNNRRNYKRSKTGVDNKKDGIGIRNREGGKRRNDGKNNKKRSQGDFGRDDKKRRLDIRKSIIGDIYTNERSFHVIKSKRGGMSRKDYVRLQSTKRVRSPNFEPSVNIPLYDSSKQEYEEFLRMYSCTQAEITDRISPHGRQGFSGNVHDSGRYSSPGISAEINSKEHLLSDYGSHFEPSEYSFLRETPSVRAEHQVQVPLQAVSNIEFHSAIMTANRFTTNEDKNKYLIPEFNPATTNLSTHEWLSVIDNVGDQKGWDEDERKYHMSSRLAGFARQWYLSVDHKNSSSWSAIKRKFAFAFPSEMDFYSQLENMMERKKKNNESMSSYFLHKVALLSACDITGRKAVSCIIGGLQDRDLKHLASEQNLTDADSLLNFLKIQSKDGNDKTDNGPKYIDDMYCSNCREEGHSERGCPFKDVKCCRCQKIGHSEKYCLRTRKENGVMYGALAQMPTYPKNYADVKMNGTTLKGYIDVASECVSVREENARALNLPFKRIYKVVRGFGGSAISTLGELKVNICVDGASANVAVFIVPDHVQAIPIVIGQEFTEKSRIAVLKNEENICFLQKPDKYDKKCSSSPDQQNKFTEAEYRRY